MNLQLRSVDVFQASTAFIDLLIERDPSVQEPQRPPPAEYAAWVHTCFRSVELDNQLTIKTCSSCHHVNFKHSRSQVFCRPRRWKRPLMCVHMCIALSLLASSPMGWPMAICLTSTPPKCARCAWTTPVCGEGRQRPGRSAGAAGPAAARAQTTTGSFPGGEDAGGKTFGLCQGRDGRRIVRQGGHLYAMQVRD